MKQRQPWRTSDFDFPSTSPASKRAELRNEAFAETIRAIPCGTVATYGQIAAAAGFTGYHRAVAKLLAEMIPGEYPWYRVVGAGGEIKVRASGAAEQRLLLKREGVTFNGKRVDLARHQHTFGERR